MMDKMEMVIITGMSGAGKTVAIQSFEDLGFYCIDNMPPTLLPTFWELMKTSGKIKRIALVIDLRSREFFSELNQVMASMENTPFFTTKILYLDANDQALVARYKETRRTHPLAPENRVSEGIRRERELLVDLKTRAQFIIDTSTISPRELRRRITTEFAAEDFESFQINVMSFGFKYGLPIDADVVIDVRFLPNPHYIPELRELTGLDQPVYDYVMKQPETQTFFSKWMDLLMFTVPGYKKEGKSSVTIAIGCTGGKHRSVALAQRTAEYLRANQYSVVIDHRDKMKKKEIINRS